MLLRNWKKIKIRVRTKLKKILRMLQICWERDLTLPNSKMEIRILIEIIFKITTLIIIKIHQLQTAPNPSSDQNISKTAQHIF